MKEDDSDLGAFSSTVSKARLMLIQALLVCKLLLWCFAIVAFTFYCEIDEAAAASLTEQLSLSKSVKLYYLSHFVAESV